jgi:predicted component of type VI protein secretion system
VSLRLTKLLAKRSILMKVVTDRLIAAIWILAIFAAGAARRAATSARTSFAAVRVAILAADRIDAGTQTRHEPVELSVRLVRLPTHGSRLRSNPHQKPSKQGRSR